MAQNKYIVSSNGFLKSFSYADNNKKPQDIIISWTPKLREALTFTTKQANNIINKYNLFCFVWNPYEEEHLTEYKVVRRSSFTDFSDSSEHSVLEWLVIKNYSPKTDIKFLTSNSEELYDLETATRIANEKNELILQEITNIINDNLTKDAKLYNL